MLQDSKHKTEYAKPGEEFPHFIVQHRLPEELTGFSPIVWCSRSPLIWTPLLLSPCRSLGPAATASARGIWKARKLSVVWSTFLMMVRPLGEPTSSRGLPPSEILAGVMLESAFAGSQDVWPGADEARGVGYAGLRIEVAFALL